MFGVCGEVFPFYLQQRRGRGWRESAAWLGSGTVSPGDTAPGAGPPTGGVRGGRSLAAPVSPPCSAVAGSGWQRGGGTRRGSYSRCRRCRARAAAGPSSLTEGALPARCERHSVPTAEGSIGHLVLPGSRWGTCGFVTLNARSPNPRPPGDAGSQPGRSWLWSPHPPPVAPALPGGTEHAGSRQRPLLPAVPGVGVGVGEQAAAPENFLCLREPREARGNDVFMIAASSWVILQTTLPRNRRSLVFWLVS